MKYFYKIENGKSITGSISTDNVPDGFIEYDPENIPKELQDIFDANDLVEEDNKLIYSAKRYLSDTDWYYARKMETGEDVPADVVTKRIEAREFLRSQEDANGNNNGNSSKNVTGSGE